MGDRATAVRFFNQAIPALQDKSNPHAATHAYQLFQSACLVDPTFGKGWYQSGNNNGDLAWLHAAIGHYRRALRGDLDHDERVKTLSNLSWRLHQLGQIDEALTTAQQAVDTDPSFAYAWVNLSCAHGAFGCRLASRAAAMKALEIAPDDHTVQFALAFALLFNGEYAEGFRYFESRFPARLQQYQTYPYPRWRGEPKHVYLVADQGLGDTLSFARFLPQAAQKAKFITAMVQPELMRAFNEAFVHLQNVNFIPSGSPFPPADCWTTFVSLPFALDLTNEQIKAAPHPQFPVYDIDTSWKVPDTKLHIGIAWAGSALNDIDKWRTIPIERFLDLYRVEGIQLYGLQTDARKDDIAKTGSSALVRDLSPWISDVVTTVAVLRHLDLVISLESFLPHLCGALDREVWVPYSHHAHDYRLGHDGSEILWYKKHRLFIQDSDMRWESVFRRIEEALREKIDAQSGGKTRTHGQGDRAVGWGGLSPSARRSS